MNEKSESHYFRVQNRPLEVSERDVACLFDQSRFDPRLMEVMTEFVRDFWWNLDPMRLNKFLKNAKSPFAIRPAILAILKTCQFPSAEVRQDFAKWSEAVVIGIKAPDHPQLFYIGINKIGGRAMEREIAEALPYFKAFHLYAKDAPFNKAKPGQVKFREELVEKRLDKYSSEKSSLALKIKRLKNQRGLTNEELITKLKINRTFLSKILNNKLDGITIDYLLKKNELAEQVFANLP